jgi:aquaporin Z
MKKLIAECLWTMVLVIFWCGVAVWTGVDPVATALAFWLVIVALAYAIGPVSGCHVNPAVSLWVWLTGKMKAKEFGLYVLAQFIWGILWALVLWVLLWSFDALGANGLDWVGGNVWLGLLAEVILTFVFVFAVLWATHKSENWSVAGLVIWLSLTLVHLLWLWLTGTSVNPARSFGPALFQSWAFGSVWVFIVAPLVWAALAALLFNYFFKKAK